MTLVAVCRFEDVPVLVGDFLITDEAVGWPHMFLPTYPGLRDEVAKPGQRRVVGMRKKVHIINDRFAVGFTGHLTAGKEILKVIKAEFGDKIEVSLDALKSLLSKFGNIKRHDAELAGWIIADRQYLFYWNIKNASELNIREEVFIGSGGKHFRELLINATASGMSPAITDKFDKATYLGVTNLGKLLATELSTKANLEHAYGYGGEIILWDGDKFVYHPKISFFFWNVIVDGDAIFVTPSDVSCVYENFGEYSCVQVAHLSFDNGVLRATNTYVMAITPMYDEMKGFDPSVVGRLDLRATTFFNGFGINNPKKKLGGVLALASDGQGDAPIFSLGKKGTLDGLQLNLRMLHSMIPAELMGS